MVDGPIDGSLEHTSTAKTLDLSEKVDAGDAVAENKPAAVVDSKCKAIFFMNLFALSATIQAALFKHVAKEGVSVIEFTFMRNVWIGGIAAIQMCYKRVNPFKGFPKALIKDLIIRSFAG